MNFNFGSLANVQKSNSVARLKPYTINENVVIKKTEVTEGSKDGNPWKKLTITFGNEDGIYEEGLFWCFNKEDEERKTVASSNGGERQLPSKVEQVLNKMAAIGFAFNPDGFAKLQSVASKLNTFDDLMNNFKKVIDKVVDKNPTTMKLVGRNYNGTLYAALPNCTGIAQATTEDRATSNGVKLNDWYTWMISPFGNNLTFTPYEEQSKKRYEQATPTTMPDVQPSGNVGSESAIDFDSLL